MNARAHPFTEVCLVSPVETCVRLARKTGTDQTEVRDLF